MSAAGSVGDAPVRAGAGQPHLLRDAAVAALLAAALLAAHALTGFPTLRDANGDNDSLLRLVEVRDLIAGQGWFDLHQYRMGPAGGFVMHWSRLVDAPIAGLVLLGTALSGSAAAGETFALVVWPTLMLALALFLLMRITRAIAGDDAPFPAAVIGAVTLRFMAIFNPGAIDHHNVQLVLALGMILCLVDGGRTRAALGGLAAAAMLAVGMETAPYVALAGVAVALLYLSKGARSAPMATGFGAGFGLGAAAAFLATVPASGWSEAQCDAYSVVQFALAAVGGFGLAAIALVARGSFPVRLAALVVLAALAAGVAVLFFPQCLGDPYAMVDPSLRTYWLDSVTEAQPLRKILSTNPGMAPGFYATAFLALAISALRMAQIRVSRAEALTAAFLATAFLVSIWQVRGSMFALPFAVPLLAAFVARRRAEARDNPSVRATLAMLAAWLVSFSVSWTAASAGVSALVEETEGGSAVGAAVADPPRKCQRPQDFEAIAAFEPTLVLASSNLGAPLLRHTPHRVLAGPYHRNNEGNLLALHALMGAPDDAEAMLRREGVALVAVCPGNDESAALADWAPQGLMAALMAGRPPAFLDLVPETKDQPLVLYRVRKR